MSIFKKKNPYKSSTFVKKDLKMILNDKSPFGVKESYGAIRTQLQFSRKNEKCPIFVITSMSPGDGKSINCANIAISFARLNKRVLIIDGDMRNPTIHKIFSLNCSNGLSELLGGVADAVNFKSTNIENLTVLTAGERPMNPAELLNSEQMDKLLKLVREHFDYVFIDSPPVSLVIDSTVLAQKVTGYVIVVRPGHSDVNEIKFGINNINDLGGKVVGFVCNNADNKLRQGNGFYGKGYYRKYSYGYKYGRKYGYGYGYGSSKTKTGTNGNAGGSK